MMERLFLPYDITTILSIPLSHRLPDDSVIWVMTKHDNFNVKSAYPIADDSIIWVMMKHDNFNVKSVYPIALDILEGKHEGESSNRDPTKPIWKKVWMLQTHE